MKAGDPVPFRAYPSITREQLKAYADASGDFNPIHQDDEVARKVGLPGVIAHGMLTSGMMAERALSFVTEELGLREARILKYSTRFRAMTFPGDVISVGGTVKSVDDEKLILDLQSRNQKGEVTTTGEVRFSVSPHGRSEALSQPN